MANRWIIHDGKRPDLSCGGRVELDFCDDSGLVTSEREEAIGEAFPSFYWDWRRLRIGWFKSTKIRVCHNRLYRPIWRYRIIGDDADHRSMRRLRLLAEDPDGDITGPEVPPLPKRKKEDAAL